MLFKIHLCGLMIMRWSQSVFQSPFFETPPFTTPSTQLASPACTAANSSPLTAESWEILLFRGLEPESWEGVPLLRDNPVDSVGPEAHTADPIGLSTNHSHASPEVPQDQGQDQQASFLQQSDSVLISWIGKQVPTF